MYGADVRGLRFDTDVINDLTELYAIENKYDQAHRPTAQRVQNLD